MLGAICFADDVVLAAASVAAAEVMVAEVIARLEEVVLTVDAEKTHWTSHSKMVDASIVVTWLCCGKRCKTLWGRRSVWMEMRGARLRTDRIKRTGAWRNGEPHLVHHGKFA